MLAAACGSGGDGGEATGAGGDPDAHIRVNMTEYGFGSDVIEVRAGQTVEFLLKNSGDLDHEFMIGREVTVGMDGMATGFGHDFFEGLMSTVDPPDDTPGVTVDHPMQVFGDDDAPHGHMHITFKDARVPASNMLLGEGRGFEISQLRLGPGRIHHCMRSIGAAERAIELMCRRGLHREAFGKPLAHLGKNMEVISRARIEIEAMRLMVLRAAKAMDTMGNAEARVWISAVKAMVPEKVCQIIDAAIQIHGATGVSQWTPLAGMYTRQRTLRLADGPDEVHHFVVARFELNRYQDGPGDIPMLDATGPVFAGP